MSYSALARLARLNVRTVRNIACGTASSPRGRQSVTTALGVEVWPGILPAERRLNFEVGAKTEYPTADDAKEAAREYRGYVKRRGKVITFIRQASFVICYDSAASPSPAVTIIESVRAPKPAALENKSGS